MINDSKYLAMLWRCISSKGEQLLIIESIDTKLIKYQSIDNR